MRLITPLILLLTPFLPLAISQTTEDGDLASASAALASIASMYSSAFPSITTDPNGQVTASIDLSSLSALLSSAESAASAAASSGGAELSSISQSVQAMASSLSRVAESAGSAAVTGTATRTATGTATGNSGPKATFKAAGVGLGALVGLAALL